jgi:hypothetical protein
LRFFDIKDIIILFYENNFFLIFFIAVALLPAITLAAPSISNVSGTISTGQTLIISGTSMVDENFSSGGRVQNQAKSYHNGASLAADGFDDGNNASYTTDTYLIGSGQHSIKYNANTALGHSDGACMAPNTKVGGDTYFSGFDYANAWYRIYLKYDQAALDAMSDPQTYFWKFGIGGRWNTGLEYFQPQPPDLNRWLLWAAPNDHSEYATLPRNMEADRWYSLELNIDSINQQATFFWDGVNLGTFSAPGAGASTVFQFGIINACINMPAGDRFLYTTAENVGSSRLYPLSIVEIGDSSNYGLAAKVSQQLLDGISDTSMHVKADLSGLGSGPYYLWVTNNRQERSAAYALSGGGDTTSPGAPEGLSVR